ncbi:RHS repeat-associated protein [Saccharothrix ecbatanensis]|uniref:RHS repeat-associated protein n=1 Tax=Saccharothrix ecbatanensis TaxID=1105145 RepID=A0A7W9HE44_9PSEU|nr:RHS repeat-associated protein [Saccharothrix ecbatanensis]
MWRARSTVWGITPDQADRVPLRFPGQYHDAETGPHYNHFRFYDPRTARYVSADPLGLGGGYAPHSCVRNPGTWFDPLGLTEDSPVGTVVNDRGVRVQIYSNDHAPPHAHVKGGGAETRIGQNGKPLEGDPELSRRQQQVVDDHIREIRNAIRRDMRRYRPCEGSGGGSS